MLQFDLFCHVVPGSCHGFGCLAVAWKRTLAEQVQQPGCPMSHRRWSVVSDPVVSLKKSGLSGLIM